MTLAIFFLLFSFHANGHLPAEFILVGKIKDLTTNTVTLISDGVQIKVPRKSIITKIKLHLGSEVSARVSNKDVYWNN